MRWCPPRSVGLAELVRAVRVTLAELVSGNCYTGGAAQQPWPRTTAWVINIMRRRDSGVMQNWGFRGKLRQHCWPDMVGTQARGRHFLIGALMTVNL